MKNFTIKNLIFALVIITGVNVLLSYLQNLGCDGCDGCKELKIVSKIILAGISIVFILRFGFGKILRDGMRVFSIWVLISLALLTSAFFFMEFYLLPQDISILHNASFLISNLSTGFFEEFFFRVFVFYFIMRLLKNTKNAIWKSTLWTSLCFGLAHTLNIFGGLDVVSSVLLIVFASVMGVILQGVYIRSNSIILVGVLHGLVNYFGTYSSYFIGRTEAADSFEGFDWLTLIGNLIILGVISLIFIVPIRRYLIFRARVPEDYLT